MKLFDVMYVIPALFILATALARLNDISREHKGVVWWTRRMGLLSVSVSMVMLVSSYFTIAAPGWNEVMRLTALWGFALTWLTTPRMVPWWKWISRYDPTKVE